MKRTLATMALAAVVFALAATAAISLVSVSSTPAEAAGCICPKLLAPVICDNGKTYPNQCVADCHHAKNCVPTGGGI